MTEERFKILFRGDIADGFLRDDVKHKLIDLFGLKEQTVDALLDGQTATLKKNLDRDGALKFKQAFEKTGAICYIRPMDDDAATSAPKPPSTPLTTSSPTAGPATPEPPAVDRSEPESFTVVDTSATSSETTAATEQEPEPVFEIPPGPSPGTMCCPKCEFVQPTADFCEACGVVILKYLKREWEQAQLAKQLEESQQELDETTSEPPSVTTQTVPGTQTPEPPATKPTPALQATPTTAPIPEPRADERSEPESFTVVDTSDSAPAAAAEAEQEPEPVFEIPPGPSPGTMRCPKCEFVQPTADFCEVCGVVILKYLRREWEQAQLDKQLEESQQEIGDSPANDATAATATEQDAPSPPAPEIRSAPVESAPTTTSAPNTPPATGVVDDPASEISAPVVEIPPGPSPGSMTCPKCEFVQPLADCCEACGIVVLKYLQRQTAEREQASTSSGDEDSDKEADLEQLRSIFSDHETTPPPAPPTIQPKPHPPEVEPFSQVQLRSFQLLRERFGELSLLWLATAVVVASLAGYHPALSSKFAAPVPSLAIGAGILLIVAWAWNTTLYLFADAYLNIKQALAFGLITLPAFLWLHFWLGTTLTGATLGLIVPGYLFFRWFCLAPLCFASEQTKGLSSLLRSRAYSLGREKVIARQLWPVLLLFFLALLGLALLPGYWKLATLFTVAPGLSVLATLYRDAAASRATLSYDSTVAQRMQWPAFALTGLLVFMIAALLTLGAGRIRSSAYALMLHAKLLPTSEQHLDSPQTTVPAVDTGVFELEIEGYRAFAYLNGEKIQEHPGGVYKRRTYSSPVKFKSGRNILAIRYEAVEGAAQPEMAYRVFRWDLTSLKDEDLGKWEIKDRQGLRRVEFHLSRAASR